MKTDIESYDDIVEFVDMFYGKVRMDDLLAPVFNSRIDDGWPTHLDKMYRFWQTLLLRQKTYSGAPFVAHVDLPVSQEHFDRWLGLFFETIDSLYQGAKADEAKARATKIAAAFSAKIVGQNHQAFETRVPPLRSR